MEHFSKIVLFLCLMFKSSIYYGLISILCLMKAQLNSYTCGGPVFQMLFLKETVFALLCGTLCLDIHFFALIHLVLMRFKKLWLVPKINFWK
jgi:hypothetical protein